MATKKQIVPTVVTLNPQWQLTFIIALILAQALSVATMIWSFVRVSHYVSSGTWTFQVVTWLYPLLYVLAGYLFARRRVRGTVPRLFWAMFIGTTGMIIYSALQMLLNFMFSWFNWWPVIGPDDKSIWSAFGITWLQMAALFAVYAVALWAVAVRKRR